ALPIPREAPVITAVLPASPVRIASPLLLSRDHVRVLRNRPVGMSRKGAGRVEIRGKVVVVTGAARGIGAAMARRFAAVVGRGGGYPVQTASAAARLIQPGGAPYSVTKHAAVAFGEWLSLTYGDQGITVSVVCPQGVRTDLLMTGLEAGLPAARAVALAGKLLEPEDVARAVLEGMADERFLILPHPEVAEYIRRKADDPGRWLAGVRRLV